MDDSLTEIKKLLKNKYLYLSIIVFLMGVSLNFLSQTYLHYYINVEKANLPVLSDLILDNIPYQNLAYFYDIFALLSVMFFIVFIIKRKQYKKIPYYLFVFGLFFSLRSIFVILTPLGNPPSFKGENHFLKGFSKYSLGTYPSGHTGGTFLQCLFAKGFFRILIFFICLGIVVCLFFSRGHYSIDILSGVLFSYALYCFGEKHLKEKLVSG